MSLKSDTVWETESESTFASNAPSSVTSSVPYAESESESDITSILSSDVGTPIETRMKRTTDLLKTESSATFVADCIRKKSNWSKVGKEHNLVEDADKNDASVLLSDIPSHSPKLDLLLKKIDSLDLADLSEHGTTFKHLIFTDLKSNGYGVKILASALVAKGMHMGYDAERTVGKGKKKFHKIQMKTDGELRKTKGSNFYLLSSVSVFDQSISVATKKEILSRFNERPANVYGDNTRFIVMDSGYKEGIDLFDIKYVHIFEPSSTIADQKQVIGRGTRTCGQKGLKFHPTKGWPLHVFIYDMIIPPKVFGNHESTFELYMKAMNWDMRLYNFAGELERATILGAVDHDLNENIHSFSTEMDGGAKLKFVIRDNDTPLLVTTQRPTHAQYKKKIMDQFGHSTYKWDKAKMENLCDTGAPAPSAGTPPSPRSVDGGGIPSSMGVYGGNLPEGQGVYGGGIPSSMGVYGGAAPVLMNYTPTQNFIKDYFSPTCLVKGMLLWHSTGSGKTCSAIATASNEFEKRGYTILWVTRTTLKNDIWKNMFDQVCSEVIRMRIQKDGLAIPSEQPKRMKLLSNSWRIRPMSYKQFSNLVSKKNQYYDNLVKINGSVDPLRKTLLIIDEAHKLYGGGDLSSIERPDMQALQNSLLNSYAVSGKDSVRLLLMTATPITTNPMEMIQLINLCKPLNEQIPPVYDDFSAKYLEEETGKFSAAGLTKYLDDIAGYVSYLNREKDARQFSQPVIHQLKAPIVDMKDVDSFDKRFTKELAKSGILELKQKIEDKNNELMGDLKDLDVNKFKALQKECVSYPEMGKDCKKVAKKNMRELVKESKAEVLKMRDEIKGIREDIAGKKLFKTKRIAEISDKITKDPEAFAKFKEGAYYNIQTKCMRKTNKNESFDELLNTHPLTQPYLDELKDHDDKIAYMENMLTVQVNAYKNKIDELKAMLKTDLRDIERSVVKMVIKDTQKTANKTKRTNLKQFEEEVTRIHGEKKVLHKMIRKQTRRVRDELKEQLKDEKQEKKEMDKAERQLKKVLRKQDDYEDEIKHDMLKGLVSKYKDKMKEDMKVVAIEAQAKATRKAQKKQDAENKKATRKALKAQEQAEKKEKKRAEQADKKDKKALEKAEKKEKKALDQAEKKEKKALDRATKKAQKDANKKTRKNTKE